MNLTGSLEGDGSNAFQTQKPKSVRLCDRKKSDEFDSVYYGKNEAMTNDVTPSLLQ